MLLAAGVEVLAGATRDGWKRSGRSWKPLGRSWLGRPREAGSNRGGAGWGDERRLEAIEEDDAGDRDSN